MAALATVSQAVTKTLVERARGIRNLLAEEMERQAVLLVGAAGFEPTKCPFSPLPTIAACVSSMPTLIHSPPRVCKLILAPVGNDAHKHLCPFVTVCPNCVGFAGGLFLCRICVRDPRPRTPEPHPAILRRGGGVSSIQAARKNAPQVNVERSPGAERRGAPGSVWSRPCQPRMDLLLRPVQQPLRPMAGLSLVERRGC